MVLVINGVDFMPFVAKQGIIYESFDRGGDDNTPNLNGDLIWERSAVKTRLSVSCRALTNAELSTALKALAPGILTVVFTDKTENATVSKTMICRQRPAPNFAAPRGGTERWSLSFALEER